MSESKRETPVKAQTTRRSMRRTSTPAETEVGAALRSVYQDMVGEGVPTEMLDLLGKLD